MATKHTPGPWEVGGPWPTISVIYQTAAGSCGGPDGGYPPEYEPIVIVWQGVDHVGRMLPEHPKREEHLANARLIAAAPELFDALKLITGNIETLSDAGAPIYQRTNEKMLAIARAAIATSARRS